MHCSTEGVQDLSEQMSRLELDRNIGKTRRLLKRVIHVASCGHDTSAVLPSVAKLMPSNDLLTKKLCAWYICQYSDSPDLLLLVLNTLLKDLKDSNSMIRGLALKTLVNIPMDQIADYAISPIGEGLHDSSSYVRRVAVLSIGKLYRLNPSIVMESGWVDNLYGMIRDDDPVVVCNCLSCLEEILQDEGGIVINRNMAHHLLNRLQSFTDWHLVRILQVLHKYLPRSEQETLDIMNSADEYLHSDSPIIVVETLRYFLFLIQHLPHLKSELFNRSKVQIRQFLGSDNSELVYSLLDFIEDCLKDGADFTEDYKAFFCKYNEPEYLKKKKITLLPRVTTSANVEEVLDELNMYCMDISLPVVKAGVKAVARIARNIPKLSSLCIERLLHLMELHPQGVTDEILYVLQELDLTQAKNVKEIMVQVNNATHHISSDHGQCALIIMLGDYGDILDDGPYILQNQIDSVDDATSKSVYLSLLTATTKMLLKRPAECQHMLSSLFEMCVNSNSVEIHDRMMFYYRLLKTDVGVAKAVLLTPPN